MDRQERIDLILDHHDKPRHRGALSEASAVYTGGNPGCGDVITVYLAVDGPGQPVKLSFEGEGCTISQASASMVMELLHGRPLHEVEAATPDALLAKLGPDIAKARERCATLAFNTVKHACLEYRRSALRSHAA
jgi:nitrogen fixation NifU-like protein